MARYAHGTHSKAICDICGLTVKYTELRRLQGKQELAGLMACRDCWTPDHPQLHIERIPPVDAEALRNPRPDNRTEGLTNVLWGWNPVAGLEAQASLGVVGVEGGT